MLVVAPPTGSRTLDSLLPPQREGRLRGWCVPMHRSVAVCICTRHRPGELARALASLTESSYRITEVVVSDDGWDDDTEAVCQKAEMNITYVRGPGRGLGSNRNRALEAVSSELVLFMDDDCLLDRQYLEQAVGCLEEHEGRRGRGWVIVSGSESKNGCIVTARDQTFLGFQARTYSSDEGLRSIVINATLFPTSLFGELQFDPQLVYGYEEVDLASRAAARGYVIVNCPQARNDHRPAPTSRAGYALHADASRLHVTFRRYAVTESNLLLAMAFAVIAPVHLIAAGAKRGGVYGARRAAASIVLAVRMLWRSRGTS